MSPDVLGRGEGMAVSGAVAVPVGAPAGLAESVGDLPAAVVRLVRGEAYLFDAVGSPIARRTVRSSGRAPAASRTGLRRGDGDGGDAGVAGLLAPAGHPSRDGARAAYAPVRPVTLGRDAGRLNWEGPHCGAAADSPSLRTRAVGRRPSAVVIAPEVVAKIYARRAARATYVQLENELHMSFVEVAAVWAAALAGANLASCKRPGFGLTRARTELITRPGDPCTSCRRGLRPHARPCALSGAAESMNPRVRRSRTYRPYS